MRVGSELKAARKKVGISVEVISKRTKIPVSKLIALEKNEFKTLPTGLYLFSAIRAYAREVRIDPEPLVEQLRMEFAGTDALDALHALDAAGALDAKTPAHARRSRERSNLGRNAAIAAGVVLIAAAGAGAGAYLNNIGRIAHDAPPSSPASAATVAATLDVPQHAAGPAADRPVPTKTDKPKPRIAAVIPEQQERVAAVDAVFEETADPPANIEELTSKPSGAATTP